MDSTAPVSGRASFSARPRGATTAAPVVHRHDDFEHASEDDLAGFEVETDAQGHHYAVRKTEDFRTKKSEDAARGDRNAGR